MKYRKKPIVIEAFQLTEKNRASNADWPDWMHRAWQKGRAETGSLFPTKKMDAKGTLSIKTLEGVMEVLFDDYIIQGVAGELYPCKPGIFEASYEPVE